MEGRGFSYGSAPVYTSRRPIWFGPDGKWQPHSKDDEGNCCVESDQLSEYISKFITQETSDFLLQVLKQAPK